MNEIPARENGYWDRVAAVWQASPRQTLWRRHSDAVNIRLFDRLLKTDLFDEAFGEGLYPLLASRAKEVIGLDLAAQALSAAGARHPRLRAVNGDVRRLPFASDHFDIVVSNSTLDHFTDLDDIARSIRELHRVLKNGGYLLITLDNPANPLIGLRNSLPFSLWSRLGLVPYFVGATLGPRPLSRLLRETGFETVDVQTVLHCPRVLAVAVAGLLAKVGGTAAQRRYLRLLSAFERLAALPTRFVTGNFVAVKARKMGNNESRR